MIAFPSGARVWLATGRTDMRKGFGSRALVVQEGFKRDAHAGDLWVFRGRTGQGRHSAYSFRSARIAYRWHPLFGRTLQVSRNRRGKDLTCIYTEERPDLARELPNWMFDETYCAGMSLGPPQVGVEALNDLVAMLAASGKSKRGPRSRPSEPKEAIRAQEKEARPKTTRAGSRTPGPDAIGGNPERQGAGRSAGRPVARSARRADRADGDGTGRR
jgi:hypothetical protein